MTLHSPHSYRVLARKYRPQRLEELIGQEPLVQVLSNAIQFKRLPHALILTGVRGVGKTTTARIIARMLNCVGPDGQGQETMTPCGCCAQCTAILEDRHIDVIEMDAASRTGVDDIRDVIEGARYKAAFGRYKVYIIDEVHMLSKNAFNALLKTLEEPPPHVVFIFATTEIKKVPETVLSRCVRFTLRRFTEQDLLKLFDHVLKSENLSADIGALKLLARAASGSARDGLSLLDQALSYDGQHVREDSVREMLNLVDRCELITLLEQLLKGQTQEAIHFLNTYYTRGGDPLTLLNELLTTCHWLSLLKIDPALTEDDCVSAQEKQLGLALAAKSSIPVLTRFWQVLLKGIHEVALVPSVLQGVQMIFIRLAYMASLPTPQQIIQGFLEGKDPTPITSHAAAGHRATGMSPAGQLGLSSENPLVSEGEKASAILNPPAGVIALPNSFKDVVALVGQKKEPLLQASLHHDVHLIDYKPGEMTVRLSSLAPRDFVPKLSEKLKLWTGVPWKIHVMSEGGDLTLAEQKQQEKKAMMAKIHANPLVKATLESFPGAVIEPLEE